MLSRKETVLAAALLPACAFAAPAARALEPCLKDKAAFHKAAASAPDELETGEDLYQAALNGQVAELKCALKAGANKDHVHQTQVDGQTRFHSAAIFAAVPVEKDSSLGSVEAVRALADAGANLDATDQEGMTPLMWAANYGQRQAVQILVSHGANVSLTDSKGKNAFAYAAPMASTAAVDYLEAHGAAINAADPKNDSRMLALLKGYQTDVLKQRPADLDADWIPFAWICKILIDRAASQAAAAPAPAAAKP